jgi:hypothetical protein
MGGSSVTEGFILGSTDYLGAGALPGSVDVVAWEPESRGDDKVRDDWDITGGSHGEHEHEPSKALKSGDEG